jgi:hypothetical protein
LRFNLNIVHTILYYVGKEEYKAKAEGYKALFIVGALFGLFGAISWILNPFFYLLVPLGILLILIGLIGYAYYSAKYGALIRTRCRFCGAEMPENVKFCPRCGRCQV